jgi:hypothetical protein
MEKTDVNETLEIMVRSTILDRPRLLMIDPEYIEFYDQDRASKAPTRFLKMQTEGLRYDPALSPPIPRRAAGGFAGRQP